MNFTYRRLRNMMPLLFFAVVITMGLLPISDLSAAGLNMVELRGLIPKTAIEDARWIGRLSDSKNISLVFSLPLQNQPELDDLLTRLYDSNDPLYGKYLTAQEFADRFGPTRADYDAVADYAAGLGLAITGTHPNRTLLNVSGSVAAVNAAFGIRLQKYRSPEGREFFAPDGNPKVPADIASRIVGIYGLDNAAVWHRQSRFIPAEDAAVISPSTIGTGPGGGLTPSDIKKAYNLSGVTANGSGQTLALFELDGYNPTDVAAYVSYYKLPSVPLENVLIDGATGNAGSGAAEVTLDIELQMALAPGASKIIVYETPNSSAGVLDGYNKIATDNRAKQISTSWGAPERRITLNLILSENAVFQQMAAQGQSFYAAAGDSGAYAQSIFPKVYDPASQPYVVGVGGTELFLNSDGSYAYETTWNTNNTRRGGGGGGGVSAVWTIPAWQQGIAGAASATLRNVPDVSLNSEPNTGYSIYFNGQWVIFGGTSCASPLWAAFTACVNQVRVAKGASVLGFPNPALYQLASGVKYGTDFHDVTEGTNLYYSAGIGYDNATGWGSFNGANLLSDLTN